jgi:transposase
MKSEVIRLNENLRKEVKLLKALQGISYKEVAEFLEIRQDSFYNWLKGYYEFSEERQRRLLDVIACLKE